MTHDTHRDTRGSIEFEIAASTARPRVLIAEDDPTFRALVANVLRLDGFEVVVAKNGAELIERLREPHAGRAGRASFDLVISDVRMPVVTGLEVLAALRGEDWATPMILMTGFGDAALHRDAERLGAAAVFDKPFDLADLRTISLFLAGRP